MKRLLILLLAAGCAKGAPVKTVSQIVNVPTPIACPAKVEYDRLKALRPIPLRQQPMPETAVERISKTAAQLGDYEAEGRWGDQMTAALDRCANP